MLITKLFQVRRGGHPEPRNKVGSQSLTEDISRIRAGNLILCDLLFCCVTLPESVVETIDHRLASFFSRNDRSFLLIVSAFFLLSQCYYSNFKEVKKSWDFFFQVNTVMVTYTYNYTPV